MTHPNLDLINRFFTAYGGHDLAALRQVMAENVRWFFPGRHPLSGVKAGIGEVVAFFDSMGTLMGKAQARVDSLVTGVNDTYVIEYHHMQIDDDGGRLDLFWSVLWTFEQGKIVEGRHLSSDQYAVDDLFTHLSR
jgi:ketosteroid isomerase-like protein